MLRFLYTEIANHGRPPDAQDLWLALWASQILIAGPEGQQSIIGWPRGPATDPERPEAAHGLLSQYIENGATDLVLVAVRQIE